MLLPSVTGFGVAVLVTLKSDCVAVATTSVAVATLLLGFESVVVAAAVTVSVITVPAGVAAATFKTTEKDAEAPEARVEAEQVRVPLATAQVQPLGAVSETKVVFAGIGSLKETVDAAAPPLFFTTTAYVMLLPAITGLGLAILVTERSAVVDEPTVV